MVGLVIVGVLLAAIAVYDLLQRRHTLLRNFPVIGHFRYLLESVGPELRQYIVVNNNEERPFDRDQRSWIYASSKKENDYFGFGTDNELEGSSNYLIIKHSTFPLPEALPGEVGYDPTYPVPCAKVLGGAQARAKAFRPRSLVNISAMSYGSLSPNAVEALNRGAKLAGCLHNTGEGGIAPAHLLGGELVWQIGTGYFGCRDEQGSFSMPRFLDKIAATPTIRAVEIKLSQGAKPGLGGVLPAAKVTPEIARIRGVTPGKDCISPATHSAFEDVDTLLDFVEELASRTGLPVGIKAAIGHQEFWRHLARRMHETGKGVDFITVDGGEGGTGAAPLVFTDHVALPFKMAMARVFREFVPYGLDREIVFIGSGKLGFPEAAMFAFALGCDMINVGREAMLSIGCIQAQRCETNRCPTGVATQSRWLMHGLDPELKSVRFANYVTVLRKEILRISRACGVCHPALVTSDRLEIIDDRFQGTRVTELFDIDPTWGVPTREEVAEIEELMAHPGGQARHPDAPQIPGTAAVEHSREAPPTVH
jgi:glutamate synthase domain-containing protein 2